MCLIYECYILFTAQNLEHFLFFFSPFADFIPELQIHILKLNTNDQQNYAAHHAHYNEKL
jgi:hypothetical protein